MFGDIRIDFEGAFLRPENRLENDNSSENKYNQLGNFQEFQGSFYFPQSLVAIVEE